MATRLKADRLRALRRREALMEGVLFLCALPVLSWGPRPLALLALVWGLV